MKKVCWHCGGNGYIPDKSSAAYIKITDPVGNEHFVHKRCITEDDFNNTVADKAMDERLIFEKETKYF